MSGAKGDAFLAEANSALNRTTIFGFGKSKKYEDAAEAFTKVLYTCFMLYHVVFHPNHVVNDFVMLHRFISTCLIFLLSTSSLPPQLSHTLFQAGNAFKLAALWESAGDAFLKAAECLKHENELTDSASKLVEAGNCFKKINPVKAIKVNVPLNY